MRTATMTRPKSKRLLKAQERFKSIITDYFVSLGARPGSFYDYELDTPAGLLHLTVYGSWIATRFDDVALGVAFTTKCGNPSNPHSGKWNFTFQEGIDPDTVLPGLEYWFERLMKGSKKR